FGSDGHIGFLASNVNGGRFNALEGNNADAVNLVPRHLGGGPNIVFIRVEGNAPAGAGAVAPAAPDQAAAAMQPAPATPEVAASVDAASAAASAAQLKGMNLPPQVESALEQAFAQGEIPGSKALGAVQEAAKHLGT